MTAASLRPALSLEGMTAVRLIKCTQCGFAMNVDKCCKGRKTLVCTCSTTPLATRKENGVWDVATRGRMVEETQKC